MTDPSTATNTPEGGDGAGAGEGAVADAGTVAGAGAVVSLRGVSKWFVGRRDHTHALSGIDLDVSDGEFVSVIGPSGCGKSTLLRVVGGLVGYESGTVEVAGTSPAVARRTKQLGFTPQTPALLPWRTVRRNARFLSELNARRAVSEPLSEAESVALLETVGLGKFLDSFPNELSGGMQQRVSLVRSFVLGAPVMLMDEPFSALDEITRNEMRYLLLDLWAPHPQDGAVRDPQHPRGRHPGRPGAGDGAPAGPGRESRARGADPAPDRRHGGRPRLPRTRQQRAGRFARGLGPMSDTEADADAAGPGGTGAEPPAAGDEQAPSPPRRPLRQLAVAAAPVIGVVLLFGLWELYVRAAGVHVLTLPPPSRVLRHLVDEPGFYWEHALVTIREATLGFWLGFAAAMVVATFMAHSRFVERATLPTIVLLQSTPVAVLAPVFLIWFGFNIWPKALTAAVFCYVPLRRQRLHRSEGHRRERPGADALGVVEPVGDLPQAEAPPLPAVSVLLGPAVFGPGPGGGGDRRDVRRVHRRPGQHRPGGPDPAAGGPVVGQHLHAGPHRGWWPTWC